MEAERKRIDLTALRRTSTLDFTNGEADATMLDLDTAIARQSASSLFHRGLREVWDLRAERIWYLRN
jgi:hypothetical protein